VYDFAKFPGGIRFLRSKEIKKMVMSKRAFQKNKGNFLQKGFIHDLISVVVYFLSSNMKFCKIAYCAAA